MLIIASPNADRSLLTLAERRSAAGVTDNSRDIELTALGGYVDAAITKACRVSVDGATPPTLRLESVSETWRLTWEHSSLILARRPVVAITSVTENDTLLTADDDYEIETASGLLYRLSGGTRICWPCGVIAMPYSAGYATVPDDLKYAAIKFMRALLQSGDRDPMLKMKRTEGVSEYQWWVDPTKDSIVPAEVMDILSLGGYVNTWVG